jgi:nucleoside-diphosphate-sugar epimerase
MKKILITGGAGYIGSILATELVKLNFQVTVLDDLYYSSNSLNHLFLSKNFNFIRGDVRDYSLIKKIIKDKDIVIPLAALVGAPLCEKKKKDAVEINFNSVDFIVRSLTKNQKIIYMNSNSGYGVGEKNKFCTEESPLKPISLYGKTKVDAENSVMQFSNSVSFRLATVFGASYRMRTDLLLNFFVYNAVKHKLINVFEPKFRRNFIHVRDVTKGIIFAINNFYKMRSNVYNLGLSNANITKIDLAKKVKHYVKDVKICIINNSKDPDKRDYFVSNKKIEQKGFVADFALEMGIKELSEIFKINNSFGKNNY